MTEMHVKTAVPSDYYSIALDEEDLDDFGGAGSWVGHVDRGGIAGATAFGGSLANGNSFGRSAALGGIAFAGGVGASMYNGGFSGGGNSSGRVICTHFYRRGMLDRELWRADMEFTYGNLSATTVRGCQYWAIPYVRLMRRSRLAERIVYPLAKARAVEVAYKAGKLPKGSYFGKLVRLIGEPICFAIGYFVDQKDWRPLWIETNSRDFNRGGL